VTSTAPPHLSIDQRVVHDGGFPGHAPNQANGSHGKRTVSIASQGIPSAGIVAGCLIPPVNGVSGPYARLASIYNAGWFRSREAKRPAGAADIAWPGAGPRVHLHAQVLRAAGPPG
jgi:hypothetical protein